MPAPDLLGPPPPSDPLGPPPEKLPELIAEARQTHAEELRIPIDQARPPVTRGGNSSTDYYWQSEDASQLGRTLSGPMLRLLGHAENMGTQFTVLRAESKVRDWCRVNHRIQPRHTWPDGEQRMVCAEIYRAVVIHGWSLPQVAMGIGGKEMQIRNWLKQALVKAWEVRREWLIYAARLQKTNADRQRE